MEDVLPTLTHDPEEFVRGILQSFYDAGFDRDEAVVRIGISGTGQQPHYSIEEGEDSHTLAFPNGVVTVRGFRHRAVFHGRSHKLILDEEAMGISWSSSATTFAEVKSILGAQRAAKKAR